MAWRWEPLALIEQGSKVFASIHARMHESQAKMLEIVCRLLRIYPELLERAQEGDFSGTYDESLDKMPDPITMIGRSYNRMRVKLQSIVLTDGRFEVDGVGRSARKGGPDAGGRGGGEGGAPEEVLLRDRPIALVGIAWVVACVAILYAGR